MKSTVAAIYGSVVALLVAILGEILLKELQWPKSAALLGAVAAGAVSLILYEMLANSRLIVRRSSPTSRVEGAWQITIGGAERPRSVCKICFAKRSYVYFGYGINANGSQGSAWTSRDLHYDDEQDELSFTSDATLTDSNERLRNYGYIKFTENAEGKYVYGEGYFVDMTKELKQRHMSLERISSAEFDKTVQDFKQHRL